MIDSCSETSVTICYTNNISVYSSCNLHSFQIDISKSKKDAENTQLCNIFVMVFHHVYRYRNQLLKTENCVSDLTDNNRNNQAADSEENQQFTSGYLSQYIMSYVSQSDIDWKSWLHEIIWMVFVSGNNANMGTIIWQVKAKSAAAMLNLETTKIHLLYIKPEAMSVCWCGNKE